MLLHSELFGDQLSRSHSRIRRVSAAPLVASVAAAVLVACGGGAGGTTDVPLNSAQAAVGNTTTTTATQQASSGNTAADNGAQGQAAAPAPVAAPVPIPVDVAAAAPVDTVSSNSPTSASSNNVVMPVDTIANTTLVAAAVPVAPVVQAAVTPNVDVGPFWLQSAGQAIAAFEAAATDAVSHWSYYGGTEFPGGSGSLSESVGQSGKGARLSYNFSCGGTYWVPLAGRSCGRYVAMQLNKLPTTMSFAAGDAPTISFDVRNLRATASPTLRVIDSTGQTLQFKTSARPLENYQGTQWTRVQLPVGSSTTRWGGANDGVLHLPIKGVSVMADDVALPSPPGDMEFDNVTYLRTPETTFTLKPNAPLSGISYPSTYVGRMGVVWRPRFGYAALDKAVAAGMTVVRFDLPWQDIEVNGKFNFTYYFNVAAELAKRNVKVLFVVSYGHPAHGGAVPLTAADQAAFAEFARRAAVVFKGHNVAGFEIWNEPNWKPFWPNPDPAAYGKLLAATVTAIRTADATVPIVTGGLADGDNEYLMALLRTGNAKGVSAIGVHPYRVSNPETFAAQHATLTQMMGAVNLNAQLWDTEWGYSSVRDVGDVTVVGDGHDTRALRRQAVLNMRKVLTNIAINMPLSILYELVDEGSNPMDREHNFGLLNADLTDKPGMVAMRALYAVQNGRTLRGLLPDVPPNLHVMRWDRAADKGFIIWSDAGPTVRTKLVLPANASKVALWDGSTPATLTASKQMYLKESDGPLIVIVPN